MTTRTATRPLADAALSRPPPPPSLAPRTLVSTTSFQMLRPCPRPPLPPPPVPPSLASTTTTTTPCIFSSHSHSSSFSSSCSTTIRAHLLGRAVHQSRPPPSPSPPASLPSTRKHARRRAATPALHRLPVARHAVRAVLLLAAAVVVLALGASSANTNLKRRSEEYQPIISPSFPHMLGATRMLKWMDDSEDPCEDFYTYSCGGFQEMYRDLPMANTLKLMQQSNSLLVEQILHQKKDKLSRSETEDRVFQKSVGYLRSCLDTDVINARGFDPILPLARELVKYTLDTTLDIPTVLGHVNSKAVYLLFRFAYSKVENADPTDLRLQIVPAPAFKIDPSVIEETLRMFVDKGVIAPPEGIELSEVAAWIAKFERMAAKAIKKHNAKEPRKHQLPEQYLTMQELNDRTGMDWNNYLVPLKMVGAEKKWYLWGDGKLWVNALKSLKNYDRTSLAFMMLWRLATSHFTKLGRESYNMWANRIWPKGVVSEYDNETEERALVYQADCVRELGVHLNYLTGHIFVKYAFNDTQRSHASKVIDSLFTSYRETLRTVKWMDDATREAALKKLGNMVRIVGYPDWVGNATEIDKYYEDLVIDEKKYFENAVQAHAYYDLRASQHQVGRPLERDTGEAPEHPYLPFSVSALPVEDQESVQINSGILQRPLYSLKNPDALNYGSIGAVIGHEITHSFDAKGYKIDYKGVKRPWWSDSSNRKFQEGKDCFVDQYSSYEVQAFGDGRTMKVNGTTTVSENIADNGGLNVALRAWRMSLAPPGFADKGKGLNLTAWEEEERLEKAVAEVESRKVDGFGGLTALQTFFVAYAQTWCSVPNYAHTRYLLRGNAHAPNEVRIKGVLSNSKAFAKAFQCPDDAEYNPEKKCFLY
ncbi:hypothetical protein DFJ73DRAFT_761004 [Zopfochytrium polystomum]|nr:hypothetical protein DFJ73DRAFT_761004 [Zopfochytrium polystomum]